MNKAKISHAFEDRCVICVPPNVTETWTVFYENVFEASIQPGWIDSAGIFEHHPVLFDWRESWQQTFVNSPVTFPERILKAIAERIAGRTRGWRTADRYISSDSDPLVVLTKGWGNFSAAPESITNIIVDVLSRAGVQTNTATVSRPQGRPKALILGRNFIVADQFTLDHQPG